MIRDHAAMKVAIRICRATHQPYTDLMVRLVASMIVAAVSDDEAKQRQDAICVVVDNTREGT